MLTHDQADCLFAYGLDAVIIGELNKIIDSSQPTRRRGDEARDGM